MEKLNWQEAKNEPQTGTDKKSCGKEEAVQKIVQQRVKAIPKVHYIITKDALGSPSHEILERLHSVEA